MPQKEVVKVEASPVHMCIHMAGFALGHDWLSKAFLPYKVVKKMDVLSWA